MAATNVFMNWKDITISYGVGPTVINLAEVTDFAVDISDELEEWQADGNRYSTVSVVARSSRGGQISGGDVAKLASLPSNTYCTVVAKLYDSINGAGDGCLTFTLVKCTFADKSAKGSTNKFAGGQASFTAHSVDGSTDPLTIVQES